MLKWAFCILLLLSHVVQGQNEYSNWYFGAYAGTTFNSGSPMVLSDGRTLTDEGVATISDVNGKLLFYTDSKHAWNQSHDTINPDTSMAGSWSSVNGAFVVQKPGSATLYYIFSTDEHHHDPPWRVFEGIHYSILDMEGGGGLGEIVTYNEPFLFPSTEKFTAVKHLNGKDVWCLAPIWDPYEVDYDNDLMYCQLLTEDGLEPPILISTGTPFIGDETQDKAGCLKASPDGKYLALGESVQGKVHVYEFDNGSASISHIETLVIPYQYGLEFSPDSRFLYVSKNGPPGFVYQYDMMSNSLVDSHIEIDAGGFSSGGLQLAPDKKIYLSVHYDSILGVINEPNELGLLSNFNRQGPVISVVPYSEIGGVVTGAQSRAGLPAGISSEIIAPNFNYGYHCFGDTAFFTLLETEYDSVYWDFGDPLSGSDNFSTDENPWHVYVQPNYHRVGLTLYDGQDSITGFHWVRATWPTIGLEDDTLVCENEVLSLAMLENGATYTWQDSIVSSEFSMTEAGTYWVSANLNGCVDYDTIEVYEIPLHEFSIGIDTMVCPDDTLLLTPNDTMGFMQWSTGSSAFSIVVGDSGYYWLDMVNAFTGCTVRDSVFIEQPISPVVDSFPANWICYREHPIDLGGEPIGGYWLGNGVDSTGQFSPEEAGEGTHWLQYTIEHPDCYLIDSLVVTVVSDFAIIEENGDQLTANPSNGSNYQWFLNGEPISGANQPSYLATTSGNYSVTLIDVLGCELQSYNLEFTLQVSIDELEAQSLLLFPDPVDDILFVKNIPDGQYQLDVFNSLGEKVLKTSVSTIRSQLDCSGFSSGIYLIRFMDETRSVRITRRFVVR